MLSPSQKQQKRLDEKISEIEERIKESERKKKSLNIDFIPFETKISQNRSVSNLRRTNQEKNTRSKIN